MAITYAARHRKHCCCFIVATHTATIRQPFTVSIYKPGVMSVIYAADASSTDAGNLPAALPTDKLACHQHVAAPRRPVVLLSCGSFNPPTVMHLRMFDLATAGLAKVYWGSRPAPGLCFGFLLLHPTAWAKLCSAWRLWSPLGHTTGICGVMQTGCLQAASTAAVDHMLNSLTFGKSWFCHNMQFH